MLRTKALELGCLGQTPALLMFVCVTLSEEGDKPFVSLMALMAVSVLSPLYLLETWQRAGSGELSELTGRAPNFWLILAMLVFLLP